MSITINQLLETVQAALSAAQGYSAHDAEREQQLQLATASAADLQSQLDAARKQIADLEAKLNLPPIITPTKNPPVMVIDYATRMAGLPIHVHAMQTPGVNQLSDIRWDFGDPKGRFNTLPGFNAAHVYENPGDYTITLTVDGASVQRKVTIAPAKLNPISKLADAQSNCRNVLMVTGIELTGTFWPKISNASIEGMAGTGTKLVYTGKDANAGIISCPNECKDLTLRELTFDSAIDKGATRATAVFPQRSSVAVIDCTGLRLDGFVKVELPPSGQPLTSGILIMGNTCPLPDGIFSYPIWLACTDAVVLGNKFVNSMRQHIIRMGHYSRVLIFGNDLQNLDRRPADPDDVANGCITAQVGDHVWIEQNYARLGGIGTGPLGGKDGIAHPEERTQYAVVKNNSILGGGALMVQHGSQHIRVTDNIIDRGAADLPGIEVDGFDATYQRTVEDLTVTGNRQIRTGGTAPAVWFKTPGAVGVNNQDNLIIAPGTVLAGKGVA